MVASVSDLDWAILLLKTFLPLLPFLKYFIFGGPGAEDEEEVLRNVEEEYVLRKSITCCTM